MNDPQNQSADCQLRQAQLERLKADIAAIGSHRMVRVLVVDDDIDSRLYIKEILANYHLEICEAQSGLEALELMASKSFDLVLLDVKMPGMDGLETHRAIKDSWPETKVFFCTGHLEWPGLAGALENGCVRVIGKNFLEKSLAEIFEPLCAKQKNT